MKSGLMRKQHPRRGQIRNRFNKLRVESQLPGKFSLPNQIRTAMRLAVEGKMAISGNPFEVAFDFLLLNIVVDLIDGRSSRLPGEARRILAKPFHELEQLRIGDVGQMRRRITCVNTPAAIAFEQDNARTGLFQEMCGSHSGYPTADDHHVDVQDRKSVV